MASHNNKVIAKNTLILYFRSILMMLIGLYTSRVILHTLGVTDFGIYNAVGGVIAMFGFISGSLSNSTSRFITVAIGKGDQAYANQVFGTIKALYYGMSLLILLLGETIGLWFLKTQMTLPAERMDAIFWVYQYSVFSAIIGLICIPYNASIIAHERMSAFAYISLLDACLKLLSCFLLLVVPYDKLVVYATLLFLIEIIDRIIYTSYCNKHFEEVRAKVSLDKNLLQEILTMAGWMVSGNLMWILNTQGINLMLNVFFGPVVNAARGIALQVQGVLGQFVTNFQTAINPQITKSCAQADFPRMHSLLHLSSKYSFFMVLLLGLPIFIEAPRILSWWLGIVPDHTVDYLRIILIYALFSTLTNPLWISVMATGKVKKYQIIDNIVQATVLPLSFIAFKFFHADSLWIFIILLISELIEIVIRAWIVLPLIQHRYGDYVRQVLSPIMIVLLVTPLLPFLCYSYLESNFLSFVITCATSICSTTLAVWFIGVTKDERSKLFEVVKTKFSRR